MIGTGLSPRVRGNRVPRIARYGWKITGLSPRVRGNRLHAATESLMPNGLSPRVRGNRRAGHLQPTPYWSEGLSPRVRGNRSGSRPLSKPRVRMGLSPRVRGNPAPVPAAAHGAVGRVYPRVCGETCIGYRRSSSSLGVYHSVYPRVCGETMVTSSGHGSYLPTGLSPRVRGNQ